MAIVGRVQAQRKRSSFSRLLKQPLLVLVEQWDEQRQRRRRMVKEDGRYGPTQCRVVVHGAGWTSSVQQ